MAEVLIKIGDSGSWKDGQPITVKPDGYLIPGADMRAWIRDGKEPAVMASMHDALQRRLRRRLVRMRYCLTHTAEEVSELCNISTAAAAEEKRLATLDQVEFEANGLDTNWGTVDLKHHFALRMDGLTEADIEDLLDRDQDIDEAAEFRGRRRRRIKYETAFDTTELANIREKELRVDVNRTAAVDKTAIVTIDSARQ